jgi:chaperonin GroES
MSIFRHIKTVESPLAQISINAYASIGRKFNSKFKYKMANIKGKVNAGKVLIKPFPAEEKTASGIIIPDSAKEKPQKGEVVKVGEPKKDEPVVVKTGDVVLYGKYSGTELTIEGNDYLLMNQSDILYVE